MSIRIVIDTTEAAPTKDGAPAYEIVRGHFHGALDPADPCNAIITDIDAAPRNRRGLIEYSATFAIAKPVDLALASGVLFYDTPNRGMGGVEADVDGHIRVISGWQGDIPPAAGLQTATVPVAQGPGGAPLTGAVFARFADMPAGVATLPVAGGIVWPIPRPSPASLDTRDAQLFRQSADNRPPVAIAPADWAFADCATAPFPGVPDPSKISLRDGFDPSYSYGLVYQGKDPKVLGVGFAATRDLVAFLRHAAKDEAGVPNPVAGVIRWAIAVGVSQAGNFLRSFLHLGFNADDQGRMVFDGMNPHIAARLLPLNIRFGVPGGAANLYELGSEGALWWTRYDDRVRGRGVSSLLDRCVANGTCPKIIETFGSAEIWGLRMSPNLVGTDAAADLPLPADVRRYYFPGVSHYGSIVGGFSTVGDEPFPGFPKLRLAGNPNPMTETWRALLKALVNWVTVGKEPPSSCYPTLAAGDLVEPTSEAMGWPAIPDAPIPDGKLNPFVDYDVGEGFRYSDLSGVAARQPPRVRRVLPSRVPRVDADGNETAGIASVQLLVPLGTYTGWNERAEGYGKGGGSGFLGGFIPFARTKQARIAAGDPRPSLEERYGDHHGFVERVQAVTANQVAAGWLLLDDARKLVEQAKASDVLKPPLLGRSPPPLRP